MASRSSQARFKRVQQGLAGMTDNLMRLKLLMALLRLRACDIQKAGFSKSYVSGVLSGSIKASPQFWMKLNAALPKIINEIGSACCVFEVEPVRLPEQAAEGLLKAG